MFSSETIKASYKIRLENIKKHFTTGVSELATFIELLGEVPPQSSELKDFVEKRLHPKTKFAELDLKICHEDMQVVVGSIQEDLDIVNKGLIQIMKDVRSHETLAEQYEEEISANKRNIELSTNRLTTSTFEVSSAESHLNHFLQTKKDYEGTKDKPSVLKWFHIIGPVANVIYDGEISQHTELCINNAVDTLKSRLSTARESLTKDEKDGKDFKNTLVSLQEKIEHNKVDLSKINDDKSLLEKKKQAMLDLLGEIEHMDIFLEHSSRDTTELLARVTNLASLTNSKDILHIILPPVENLLKSIMPVGENSLITDAAIQKILSQIMKMIEHFREIVDQLEEEGTEQQQPKK